VQLEALAVRLRPRTGMEAADLGVRLCQRAARSVYSCYAVVAVPIVALALATFELAGWLPMLLIWWAKPWLDRTVLFVLSRAAFGQRTSPADVWEAQRRVWWRQLLFTWTIRRFSPWRSVTQPVYTLEDLSVVQAHARVRQVRRRTVANGLLMTQAFAMVEIALACALGSLVFWFMPSGYELELFAFESPDAAERFALIASIAYAVAVLFLEPFYVGAGFGIYLNRRAELEAWDVEQELRRAFAA
jgi:hypothetical protein